MANTQLVPGLHKFHAKSFRPRTDLLDRLHRATAPEALIITCSDARLETNPLTLNDPPRFYTVRIAGNIVPIHRGQPTGEAASIEYALNSLKVTDVIVAGHYGCTAMQALLKPAALLELPLLASWLEHAEGTRRIMWDAYQGLTPECLLEAVIQENVLVQLENVQTHPAIAARLEAGTIKLHGWVFDTITKHVQVYDPNAQQFISVHAVDRPPSTALGSP